MRREMIKSIAHIETCGVPVAGIVTLENVLVGKPKLFLAVD